MLSYLVIDKNTNEEVALESKMFSRFVESAQKKVEGSNYDSRKAVLEYDEVLRKQREIIYGQRAQVLFLDDISETIKKMMLNAMDRISALCVDSNSRKSLVDPKKVIKEFDGIYFDSDTLTESEFVGKTSLETADILGAKNIRLFSFYIPDGKSTDGYKNEVISRLGEFLDIAKDSGIDLCHENEKGIYGAKAKECLEIHRALPEMKGIFDPANFVQCGQDTLEAWDMLGKYIKYMHIKDALWDGRVVPAGKGDGNVEKIVSKFISNGGRDFTIEPHLTVFDGLAGLEKDGNTSEVGTLYSYPTKEAAFKAAVDAFKSLI